MRFFPSWLSASYSFFLFWTTSLHFPVLMPATSWGGWRLEHISSETCEANHYIYLNCIADTSGGQKCYRLLPHLLAHRHPQLLSVCLIIREVYYTWPVLLSWSFPTRKGCIAWMQFFYFWMMGRMLLCFVTWVTHSCIIIIIKSNWFNLA